MNKPRIVFMGTPDFAVPCLEILLKEGYDVPAVFTQPDRPKGRGNKLAAPPVKELALRHGIPVHQPTKLRDGEALALLEQYAPDLIVVVAYGRILPKDILDLPPLGCINVHASLLPKLRGAAPIQWSIINGDEKTGVTIMYLAEGMDEGDIITTTETPIGPEETAGELFGRLSQLGADCLAQVVPVLADGSAGRTPQNHAEATYAPMIEKSMAFVDFKKSPEETKNLIHGLNPNPYAYTLLDGKRIKLHKAAPVPGRSGAPGKVLSVSPLIVGCGDGALELQVVQPEGKAPMDGASFANGRRLQGGELLGNPS